MAREKRYIINKKMGRPTNNPRPHKLSIRINDTSKKIIEGYCNKFNVNVTETIERALIKLRDDVLK